MKILGSAAAWVMLAAGTSGCAMHARSRALGPPLDMPPPPARVVPIESQPIVAKEPLPPTPEPSPGRVDREPQTVDDVPSRPSPPARSEAPADAGAATTAAPAPAPTPPPVLQTTANPSEAEQRTRAALEKAKSDLARIDLKRLNREARSQYDIAGRFVEQAEEALRARNPVFAEQLADKAKTLAALLQNK